MYPMAPLLLVPDGSGDLCGCWYADLTALRKRPQRIIPTKIGTRMHSAKCLRQGYSQGLVGGASNLTLNSMVAPVEAEGRRAYEHRA